MKFFELFEWTPHFNVDLKALKKKYYSLSRTAHPDFFTQESEDVQSHALADSTQLNLAYKTLKNPTLLLKYILEEEGIALEGKSINMPQDFLMEMMDINEAIMELQFDPDEAKLSEARKSFDERMAHLTEAGNALKADYNTSKTPEVLEGLKDYYFKMKYLNRMAENLNNEFPSV